MLYQLSYQSDCSAARGPQCATWGRATHLFKKAKWSIGVSIPVPRACKARTLPIELMPQNAALRLPGIEPGSSAWEAPMITITLQALRAYSRRGSNPRPPAHKTGALPLSYWSVIYKSGDRQRSTLPRANQNSSIPDGTRTHNLRLRKPTPCPFGHWDSKRSIHLQWDSNPQSHP